MEDLIKRIIKEETNKKLINEWNPLNNWWARFRAMNSRLASPFRNVARLFMGEDMVNPRTEAAFMRVKSRSKLLDGALNDFIKDLDILYTESKQLEKIENKIERKQDKGRNERAESLKARKELLDSFVETLKGQAEGMRESIQSLIEAKRDAEY